MEEEDFTKYELFKDISSEDINTFTGKKRKIPKGLIIFLIFLASTFGIVYYMFFIKYDIDVSCRTELANLPVECSPVFYDKNGNVVEQPLPRGKYKVRVSVTGYQASQQEINVPEQTSVVFKLKGFDIKKIYSDLDTQALQIYPKVHGNVTFLLVNRGPADVTVFVNVEGDSPLDVNYPDTITLKSGEEKNFTITFFCESEQSVCGKGLKRTKKGTYLFNYTVVFTINNKVKLTKEISVELLKDIDLSVSGDSSVTLYENETKVITLSIENRGDYRVKNIYITQTYLDAFVQNITPSFIDELLPGDVELVKIYIKAPEITKDSEEFEGQIVVSVDKQKFYKDLSVRVQKPR